MLIFYRFGIIALLSENFSDHVSKSTPAGNPGQRSWNSTVITEPYDLLNVFFLVLRYVSFEDIWVFARASATFSAIVRILVHKQTFWRGTYILLIKKTEPTCQHNTKGRLASLTYGNQYDAGVQRTMKCVDL